MDQLDDEQLAAAAGGEGWIEDASGLAADVIAGPAKLAEGINDRFVVDAGVPG